MDERLIACIALGLGIGNLISNIAFVVIATRVIRYLKEPFP